MLSVLIRIVSMSTHNIHFHDKIRKFPYIFVFLSYRKNFVGTQKRVRISHNKRAIGVRAIQVWLYHGNKLGLPIFSVYTVKKSHNKHAPVREWCLRNMYYLYCRRFSNTKYSLWVGVHQFQQIYMCAQRKIKSASTFEQSEQNLRWPHEGDLGP